MSTIARNAQVAQSVEQRTENPRVGGSIPPLGTTARFSNLGYQTAVHFGNRTVLYHISRHFSNST